MSQKIYITQMMQANNCVQKNLPVHYESPGEYTIKGLIESSDDYNVVDIILTVRNVQILQPNARFAGDVPITQIRRGHRLRFEYNTLYYLTTRI